MAPTIVGIGLLALAWLLSYWWLNREVHSKPAVHNPGGDRGKALVIYHPGPGTLHSRVVAGFVEGLVSGGWQAQVATATTEAPTDLAQVDLLVLGSPTYWFSPSLPILRTLKRLGDLDGQPTAIIITGLGSGGRASSMLQRKVRRARGNLVTSLALYRLRPNDDDNPVSGAENMDLAVELARQAAESLVAVTK